MRYKIGNIIMAVLIACASVSAQTPEQPQEVLRISTDLVVLDAQVQNKKTGAIIGNLKPADFELTEDGIKQEIAYFSVDKLPLSIVLLLDVSGSVQPFIDQISAGALQALQRLKPEDEVAVMAFAWKTQLIQGFTKDRQLVAQQIQRVNEIAKVGRGTDILVGINEAAKVMNHATSPVSRRVIITVTDNSALIPRRMIRVTEKETLDNLFESGSVVCGLIVRGLVARIDSVVRWSPAVMAHAKYFKVDPLAEQTGGEMMNSDKPEVDRKLGELFDHLRSRYSIGFISTNPNFDGGFRKLSLKLSPEAQKQNRDAIVRTRQGYYARHSAKGPAPTK